MENFFYKVVAQEMVWIHYYDEHQNKHFRELLGAEARTFRESMQYFSKELDDAYSGESLPGIPDERLPVFPDESLPVAAGFDH